MSWISEQIGVFRDLSVVSRGSRAPGLKIETWGTPASGMISAIRPSLSLLLGGAGQCTICRMRSANFRGI
jgi:hypothetical protein